MTHRIDPERDRPLIEEFRRWPIGRHSPDLMRLLHVLRTDTSGRQTVLFCREPFRAWVIAELPADRRERIRFEDEPVFTSREEAEWEVFRRRWRAHTGEHINLPLHLDGE